MTSSRLSKLSLPLVLILLSPAVLAADTAHDWLVKMNRAAGTLNYDGVFVYQHADQLQSMRIIHRADGNSRRERLVALSGVGREVIRTDSEVRCYLPDENAVLVEHRKADAKGFPNLAPRSPGELDENYDIRLGKTGRVANRKVQSVAIRPKDAYRYGYHLWADIDTGLLLKAYLIDHQGSILEQFMFTQVTIGGKIPDSDLEPQNKGSGYVWYREPAPADTPAQGAAAWTVTQLPKGFSLSTHMLRTLANRQLPVEQMVYSDGLAVISVFVERLDAGGSGRAKGVSGLIAKGAVNAYGSRVGTHQVTVVGEVPVTTIRLIGGSVVPSRAVPGDK
ncbi:MAG: MucB/RseB C-terminal domain-containing protein [Gammaproteobacteria bacterium]|nr:MucB/RseB C-terminal domain-containing protein [Gammaproteobacteria bacterium]